MLTPRQKEIATLAARGLTTKAIARQTGLAVPTVNAHIRRAAGRMPGTERPRYKLMLWFFSPEKDTTSAA